MWRKLAAMVAIWGCVAVVRGVAQESVDGVVAPKASNDGVAVQGAGAASMKDKGQFSQFDAQVVLHRPSWLSDSDAPSGVGDADADGIPDHRDILRGAKKADLNDARYGSPYRKLRYPMGDVPSEEGVCTDVVIRSLRNAGIDLQRLVHEDIKKRPRAFPMVKRPNPHIDHRRVKTLLPHFKRHWQSLPTRFSGHKQTWLPGDIVFMQLFGDARPDHVGVVSDELGSSGQPLIINNWAPGWRTEAMDILPLAPVTHRFRWSGALKSR